ncbi:MAG: hypothetical protein QXK57_07635, partial [Conexivisphaerales archaeon]
IPEVLGILHEPEGKAVGESYELIRNPRRDLRMISTLRDICSTEQMNCRFKINNSFNLNLKLLTN